MKVENGYIFVTTVTINTYSLHKDTRMASTISNNDGSIGIYANILLTFLKYQGNKI